MTERDRYIPGVPCWVDTSQPDPAAAAEFYGGLFGWDLENEMPPGSPGAYFMARLGGGVVAAVGSVPEGAPPMAMWNTYVWVESADETASKVREAGGTVIAEPFDIFDSGRMAVFADPEGAVFGVWQPREHRGATVVNEPGSLNFNDLHTRDPERAKAFYGAVFGWDTIDIGVGEMWTLAAYGDFLEARTPGNRARMADIGAPRGSRASSRAHPDPGRTARHAGALGRHVRRRRRRRDRRARRRARRDGGRRAVRRAVGADDRHHRPPGRDVHRAQFVPENRDLAVGASSSHEGGV